MTRLWDIGDVGLPDGPFTNLLYLLPLSHGIIGDLPRTASKVCWVSPYSHGW
jgi:hypothetical protein